MKKALSIMMLAALGLGGTVPMTGCDDDDDNFDYQDLTLLSEIDLDFEDDFMQLCDVQVTATNFQGQTQTVALTAPDWAETLSTTTFPANCAYTVTITKKPNVQLTKATYDLDCDISYEADSYLGKTRTKVVPEYDVVLSNAEKVPAAQVDAELDKIIAKANATTFNYTFTKTSDNKVVGTVSR